MHEEYGWEEYGEGLFWELGGLKFEGVGADVSGVARRGSSVSTRWSAEWFTVRLRLAWWSMGWDGIFLSAFLRACMESSDSLCHVNLGDGNVRRTDYDQHWYGVMNEQTL